MARLRCQGGGNDLVCCFLVIKSKVKIQTIVKETGIDTNFSFCRNFRLQVCGRHTAALDQTREAVKRKSKTSESACCGTKEIISRSVISRSIITSLSVATTNLEETDHIIFQGRNDFRKDDRAIHTIIEE